MVSWIPALLYGRIPFRGFRVFRGGLADSMIRVLRRSSAEDDSSPIAASPPRRAAGHGIRDGHFDGFRVGLPAHSAMDLDADGLDVAADAGGEVAPEAVIEPGNLDQPRCLSVSAAINGRPPQVVWVEHGSRLPPRRLTASQRWHGANRSTDCLTDCARMYINVAAQASTRPQFLA